MSCERSVGVGIVVVLGGFGDIFFNHFLAGTKNGFTLLGGSGNLIPMVDINRNTIAVASAKADELILIENEDHSP